MSNASTYLSSGAAIKSVQSGVLSASATSHTITISAVNPANCVLIVERLSRGAWYSGSSYIYGAGKLVLTNSTTLTFTQNHAYNTVLRWRLVEYTGGVKSRQFVTTAAGVQGISVTTIAISAVNPAKTIVTFNGAQFTRDPVDARDTNALAFGWLESSTTFGYVPLNQTVDFNLFQITEFE
jgi:hypothetical protein